MSLSSLKLGSEMGRDERVFKAANYLASAGVDEFSILVALKKADVSLPTLLSYYKEIHKNYEKYVCGREVLSIALNESMLMNMAPSKRAAYLKNPKY